MIFSNYIIKLKFLVLFLFLFLSSCGPINNTLIGFKPDNPRIKKDIKTKGSEFSSLAQNKRTLSGDYVVQASLGNSTSDSLKKTNSSSYKVYFTVQGELSSIKR